MHRLKCLRPVNFWATVYKTVRPMLSDCCLSCPVYHVCEVGALWPNGWMDQYVTEYGGRPRPGHIGIRTLLPPERGTEPPTFRPMSIVTKRSPNSATAELVLSPVTVNFDLSLDLVSR